MNWPTLQRQYMLVKQARRYVSGLWAAALVVVSGVWVWTGSDVAAICFVSIALSAVLLLSLLEWAHNRLLDRIDEDELRKYGRQAFEAVMSGFPKVEEPENEEDVDAER